ncbi:MULTISPECIES: helix-turn-helix domain-containing protein [Polaromonas]|uniref:Helix-turn-helix domain-containing protein n=1 Tax=Polaromonas aquatica TaxID=332657 RepID=A0ABW1TU46_9BURK
MNTLKSIAESLRKGRKDSSDVDLASKTGLTRQSVSRALSGDHNFTVTTLLAIAEANGQEVVLVPRDVARALSGSNQPPGQSVATMTDELRRL